MASLVIRKVRYFGNDYSYESPELDAGVAVVAGPNGTGKTTFSSLLYFGLGGNPHQFSEKSNEKQAEIVGDTENYVDVEFEINGVRYLSRRFFEKNYAVVGEIGKPGETLQINRNKRRDRVFSDWLLEKLGLEVALLNLGSSEWQLNIFDYMRLMYQNQAIQERTVFKSPDIISYVTESSQNRKAIFELLMGKLNSDLYKIRGEYKNQLTKKILYKNRLETFEEAIKTVFKEDGEIKNIVFLENEISENEDRLDKLLAYKKELQKAPIENVDFTSDIKNKRQTLINLEAKRSVLGTELDELGYEHSRYKSAITDLKMEVDQVNKILFSHEKLNLFFPETCPYCLDKVERKQGECICGKPVDESEFEKFFYEPEEYINIIKGKSKNIDTLNDAIIENEKDQNKINQQIDQAEELRLEALGEIDELVNSQDCGTFDTSKLDEIDDNILDLKSKISDLEKAISLETERNELNKIYNATSDICDELSSKVKELEGKSERELLQVRRQFNSTYQELMMESIQGVTSARIDDEYEPSINDGTYREMSIIVGKRLFYYLTLFKMATSDEAIPFPRFLLIDTPKTAGLDSTTLKRFLLKLKDIGETKDESGKFLGQIILTTGDEDCPEGLVGNTFEILTEESRLLKKN